MSEEQLNTGEEEIENQESELDNAAVKKSPLFRKIAGELAERNRLDAEREADAKAEADAKEQERLKEAGRFDEAKKLYDESIAEIERKHSAKILEMDLKSKLLAADFRNKRFISGSISDYDPETCGTVEEYVKSLVDDPDNAGLLKTTTPTPLTPPGKIVVTGNTQLTTEQIKALEKSDDPAQKKQWQSYAKTYFSKYGKMPD